jgi:hypothetical protein
MFAILICTAHFISPLASYAGELYRWVDEKGDIHFSDTLPDDSSSKGKIIENIHINDSPPAEKEKKDSEQKKKDTSTRPVSRDVTIYSLDT